MGDPHIRFPMELEQHMMEGCYNHVLSADARVPHPTYTFFTRKLIDTIRGEIADSMDKSYLKLSIKAAQEMLQFKSPQEVTGYIQQNCGQRPTWRVEGDYIVFHAEEKRAHIPALQT